LTFPLVSRSWSVWVHPARKDDEKERPGTQNTMFVLRLAGDAGELLLMNLFLCSDR
jgi:hypothetical protein